MAFIPIIGGAVGAIDKLFKSMERGVNSSEHNFKKDLLDQLAQAGMPPETLARIKEYLNQGSDGQIGDKLRAMMSSEPPVIPPEMAEGIAGLAQANGVPRTSIDQSQLAEPLSSEEASQTLGSGADDFLGKLGVAPLGSQDESEFPGEDEEGADDEDDSEPDIHDNIGRPQQPRPLHWMTG